MTRSGRVDGDGINRLRFEWHQGGKRALLCELLRVPMLLGLRLCWILERSGGFGLGLGLGLDLSLAGLLTMLAVPAHPDPSLSDTTVLFPFTVPVRSVRPAPVPVSLSISFAVHAFVSGVGSYAAFFDAAFFDAAFFGAALLDAAYTVVILAALTRWSPPHTRLAVHQVCAAHGHLGGQAEAQGPHIVVNAIGLTGVLLRRQGLIYGGRETRWGVGFDGGRILHFHIHDIVGYYGRTGSRAAGRLFRPRPLRFEGDRHLNPFDTLRDKHVLSISRGGAGATFLRCV